MSDSSKEKRPGTMNELLNILREGGAYWNNQVSISQSDIPLIEFQISHVVLKDADLRGINFEFNKFPGTFEIDNCVLDQETEFLGCTFESGIKIKNVNMKKAPNLIINGCKIKGNIDIDCTINLLSMPSNN